FSNLFADLLEPMGFCHRQIRATDVPGVGRELVTDEKVLNVWVANSWPSLDVTKEQIHGRRNLRYEIIDVGVPFAVVGSGEQQLRVVVEEYEAHIVERANDIRTFEITFRQFQQAANPLGSAF